MDGDVDVFAMGSAASGVIWFEHINSTLVFDKHRVSDPGEGRWQSESPNGRQYTKSEVQVQVVLVEPREVGSHRQPGARSPGMG